MTNVKDQDQLELLAENVTAITRFNILLERMSMQDFERLPNIHMLYLPNYYFVCIINPRTEKASFDPKHGLIPAHSPKALETAIDLAKKYQSQGKTVEIRFKGSPVKKFKGKVKEPTTPTGENPSTDVNKTFSAVQPQAEPATNPPMAVNQPVMP